MIAIGYSDILLWSIAFEEGLLTMIVRDPLSALPGYLLRRAANAMMLELQSRLSNLGLRISDASVLLLLGNNSNLTSSDIGKVLDIQRANMVPILARLEAADLIERLPIDRKSQAVVLTDAGRLILTKVKALTEDFETDLMGRIPEPHRSHFVPALQALVGTLPGQG